MQVIFAGMLSAMPPVHNSAVCNLYCFAHQPNLAPITGIVRLFSFLQSTNQVSLQQEGDLVGILFSQTNTSEKKKQRKKGMKRMYSFKLADGRTAISASPLIHAIGENGTLDLAKLSEQEQSQLSLFADPFMAYLFQTHCDGGAWLPPEVLTAMTSTERLNISHQRNYCIMAGNQVLVRDGEYKPLESFVASASKEELKFALYHATLQTALAQMYVASTMVGIPVNTVKKARRKGGCR